MPREITDPAEIAALEAKLARGESLGDVQVVEHPQQTDQPPEGVNLLREGLSGEGIPHLVQKLTGSGAMRELDQSRRSPMVPEYRQITGSPLRDPLQFAANIAGDAQGRVAALAALPVEAATVVGRTAGDLGASALTDAATYAYRHGVKGPSEALFDEATAKHLADQQDKGNFRTVDSVKRQAGAGVELAKGIAFGLWPAAYAGAEAAIDGHDIADATWETFKAYPLASILPGVFMAREAATFGGKAVVREGVPIQTVAGKPVKLNKLGEKVFEPVQALEKTKPVQSLTGWSPDSMREVLDWGKRSFEPAWQKLAFDAVSAQQVKRQAGITASSVAAREAQSPVAGKMATQQYTLLRDMEAELAHPDFVNATAADKFAAIEGTLGGKDPTIEAPVLDAKARAQAQSLGEAFMSHGMALEDAQAAVPYLVFEGLRAHRSGAISDPLSVLPDTLAKLGQMQPQQAQQFATSIGALVKARMNDPTFVAAADQAWNGKGIKWVPGAEVRMRDGYVKAMQEIRDADKAAGKPVFELSIPELGEFRRDYTAKLYDTLVDDLASSDPGRQRVLQLLRSSPMARMAANPTAPTHIQALAAWAMQPGGLRRQLVDLINQSGIESAEHFGHDPVVIAKHFDRYLSRSFTDAIDAGLKLDDLVQGVQAGDTSAARKIGEQVRSPRMARKVSDTTAHTRFQDMVNTGQISLHDALASTVANAIALNSHLSAMSGIHEELSKVGLVSDTQKPGFVQLSTERAAEKSKAASPDPYNYTLGKMGGKWVDPVVAREMGYAPAAFGKLAKTMPAIRGLLDLSTAALGTARFGKTVANFPGYQIRNAITDPLVAWAASGQSPYTGMGRRLTLKSAADLDRFHDPKTAGAYSQDLRDAMDAGIVDPNATPSNDNMAGHAQNVVGARSAQIRKAVLAATDPNARVNAFARAAMMTADTAKLPVEAVQAIWAGMKEANSRRRAGIAQGESPAGTAAMWPSQAIEAGNAHLNDSALAHATARLEQQRRYYTYLVGRHVLKLDKDRAAIFARETMYGIDKPGQLMSAMSTNPATLFVLPAFLRYGFWQTGKATMRASNDPHLWAAYAIEQGVRAAGEHQLLQDASAEKDWRGRIARSYMQRSASPDVGLGHAADFARVLRSVGLPEFATKAIERKDPLLAWDLRDVGGYQTFLHQIRTDLDGEKALLQFGLLGGALSQAVDPNMVNFQDPQSGVPPLPNAWPRAEQVVRSLVRAFLPIAHTVETRQGGIPIPVPFGQTTDKAYQFLRSGDEGLYKGQHGDTLNVLEMGKALGPIGLTSIDGTAFLGSLSRRVQAEGLDIARAGAKAAGAVSLNDRPEVVQAHLTEAQVATAAKLALMQVSLGWVLNLENTAQAREYSKQIAEARDLAIKEANANVENGSTLSEVLKTSRLQKLFMTVQHLLGQTADEYEGED